MSMYSIYRGFVPFTPDYVIIMSMINNKLWELHVQCNSHILSLIMLISDNYNITKATKDKYIYKKKSYMILKICLHAW